MVRMFVAVSKSSDPAGYIYTSCHGLCGEVPHD